MKLKNLYIHSYVTILVGSGFCAVVLMVKSRGENTYRIKWTTGNLILHTKSEVLALAESWSNDYQTGLRVQSRMRWPQWRTMEEE